MSQPTFTILLPVIRPPGMLPLAVASVLEQTRQDFELFIICDGAPPETGACAEAFAAQDPRIRAFIHPKGPRNGELYRDQALRSARGQYICQIADDDLWFPNHLEEMAVVLSQVEFGNVLQTSIRGNGAMQCLFGDLARAGVRKNMRKRAVNFFGPTAAGYHLATYRRLPVGWSPAPPEIWSDLYMWRKFLALPDITCATRFVFTCLHVAADPRRDLSDEKRAEENRRLLDDIRDPARRDAMVQQVMQHLMLRAQLTDRTIQQLVALGGLPPIEDAVHENDELLAMELAKLNRVLPPDEAGSARGGRPLRKVLRWLASKA